MKYVTKQVHKHPEIVEAIQLHCEANIEGVNGFPGDWIVSSKQQGRYSPRVFIMPECDFRMVYMEDNDG